MVRGSTVQMEEFQPQKQMLWVQVLTPPLTAHPPRLIDQKIVCEAHS